MDTGFLAFFEGVAGSRDHLDMGSVIGHFPATPPYMCMAVYVPLLAIGMGEVTGLTYPVHVGRADCGLLHLTRCQSFSGDLRRCCNATVSYSDLLRIWRRLALMTVSERVVPLALTSA